jgi:hypothetical protein
MNENCSFAHNFVEQIYHVDSYKKRYCKDYIEKNRCKYDAYCAMAHSDLELKITPLHLLPVDKDFLLFSFKSEFCPFSKINHDRFKCVYAHNWQDYKRPYNSSLQQTLCKSWDKNKEILEYDQGCERGFQCIFSHGWKEVEYHFLNFKRQTCKMGTECERREICSFIHDNEEPEKESQGSNMFYPCGKAMMFGRQNTLKYLIHIEVDLKKAAVSVSNESSFKDARKVRHLKNAYSPVEDYFDEDDEFDNPPVKDKYNSRSQYQEVMNRHFSSKTIAGGNQLSENDIKGKSFYSEKYIHGLLMNKSGNNVNETEKTQKLTQANKLTSFEQKNFYNSQSLYEAEEDGDHKNKSNQHVKVEFAYTMSYNPEKGLASSSNGKKQKQKPSFDIVSIEMRQGFQQKVHDKNNHHTQMPHLVVNDGFQMNQLGQTNPTGLKNRMDSNASSEFDSKKEKRMELPSKEKSSANFCQMNAIDAKVNKEVEEF